MKNLVYSTLLAAVATQAAGCIIVSDDDGGGLGSIHASWALKSTDLASQDNHDVTLTACPAGATTATVFSLPAGAAPASAFQDKFDCIDGAGHVTDLEPGSYTVWVQLTDTSGATKFAESGSQSIIVTDGGTATAPYDIYVDRAFALVGWNLTGRYTSCDAVAGSGVSILATDGGGAMRGFDTVVNCSEGAGRQTITQPLPIKGIPGFLGTYTLALSLLDANDGRISETTTVANKTLDYGNEYEDLGIVNINSR